MIYDYLLIAGGVGIFLLGMRVLTEGLRALAGTSLHHLLSNFTKSPYSGAATGAIATATIQSSSAVTVMAVGFVGAGLLTFPQSLGIIFGANLGTTITGWMLAILGFKLKLGTVALPLVLVGVLMNMFGRGRVKQVGWSLAGFSLLFVGLSSMQDGLAVFEGVITPDDFPEPDLLGRLQLVGLGFIITLITQSSSAGVATVLVALHAGTITLPQGAALVIGMDIGTTATALFASIGGSSAMRRTSYAHVLFNLFAGSMGFIALIFLTPWLGAMGANGGNTQIALVAFHSCLNGFAMLVILPFTRAFGRLIRRAVPERRPGLVGGLDDGLLSDPAVAIQAVLAALRTVAVALLACVGRMVKAGRAEAVTSGEMQDISIALSECEAFLGKIHTRPDQVEARKRLLSCLHAYDHLTRLHFRCTQSARIGTLREERRLRRLSRLYGHLLDRIRTPDDFAGSEHDFNRYRKLLRRQRERYRAFSLNAAASGEIDPETLDHRLDAIRWLHRTAYHVWRIADHLSMTERS